MKKLLAIILVAVMALGVLPFAASADETFTWDEATGTLTVLADVTGTLTWDNGAATEDTFPWAEYRQQVKKVIFADNVTTVGSQAFSRAGALEEVVVGSGCFTIGSDAFSYDAALTKITFNAAISSIGQGIVYSSNNVAEVTITNQTKDEFMAVATAKPYNTAFENATFTTQTSEVELDWPQTVTITPKFDVIENWSGDTYLIWELTGATNESLDAIHAKMKDDTYTVKYVITDETDDKTYTITKYNKVGGDIGDWAAWYRIGTGYYGITLVADHAYTLAVTIYEGEEVRYTGVSEEGAFVSKQAGFIADGAITPEEVPYTYEEATPVDPPVDPVDPPVDPVDPPQAGDATVMIAVLAVVALFGAAVVTKKVFVK